jgi:Putative abortive phage resistance protein AbiGi, antitoxin
MSNGSLSANSLFHFTNTIDKLQSILVDGFWPRYCLETWDIIIDNPMEYAFPMVCFCDIPLTQTRNHTDLYGRYGIGLDKRWGIRKGITPVLYAYKGSRTTALLGAMYDANINKEKLVPSNEKLHKDFIDFIMFTKPYSGPMWRGGSYIPGEIRFYDEREWRYIPDISMPEGMSLLYANNAIYKNEYLNNEYRKSQEKLLQQYNLVFVPDDIRYIIVSTEHDVSSLLTFLDKELTHKFAELELQLLKTKIVSVEQIGADF